MMDGVPTVFGALRHYISYFYSSGVLINSRDYNHKRGTRAEPARQQDFFCLCDPLVESHHIVGQLWGAGGGGTVLTRLRYLPSGLVP